MIWLLGPLVGVAVVILGLQWALRSHRRDRKPWLELLAVRGTEAASTGGLGALDGLASDGDGALLPLDAPFSGRKCLAFHLEIITQEQFGNQTTWRRVFQDGAGQLFLSGPDGQRRGWVNLQGTRVIFPTPLDAYTKLSLVVTPETVFQGTLDRAPQQLVWFVQQLPAEIQQLILRPSRQLIGGKRVYFNERIVIPGQSVVAAGRCEPGPAGVNVSPTDGAPVCLGLGTLESERARVAKLPIASELIGAILGGFVACAVVEMFVSMIFAK